MEDEKAKKAVRALRARIETVEQLLGPLLQSPLAETYGKLPVNEKAQLQVLLSFALNTLFFSKFFLLFHHRRGIDPTFIRKVYLKSQGKYPQSHEVSSELVTIKFRSSSIKRSLIGHSRNGSSRTLRRSSEPKAKVQKVNNRDEGEEEEKMISFVCAI